MHKMFSVFRRKFASAVFELGPEVNLNSLAAADSLSSLADVEQAPEGSVVFVDAGTPTQFQKSEEAFRALSAQNYKILEAFSGLQADNLSLKAEYSSLKLRGLNLEDDVRVLKLTPSAMQICETLKSYQNALIEEYLPDIHSVLQEKDRRFKFLKGKSSKLIGNFLKLPVVMTLDSFISTKEFRKITEFRNLKADEAVSDIDLLSDNFEAMIKYFTTISKDFDSESLNFDKLRGVHEHVQKIEQKNDL